MSATDTTRNNGLPGEGHQAAPYRAILVATDAAGNRLARARLSFSVVGG